MSKRGKLYGDRWRAGEAISAGGQGDVFRATDTTGVLEGEYALKRVRNAKRHARFRAEVEAIKRLQHPNVIRLIDHSALDSEDLSETRQFLVMPIAAGGDLSAPTRVALYHNNLDSTLSVALQLASALDAAHAADVIHRDVKPENVLFTGHGHDAWLTDFGICLLREAPRITPADEIVGPRGFIAPECEDGGLLNVDGRADIYALGKVIYYMLSGGKVVPRERMHEPQFADVFQRGERYKLLQILLQQMICPLEHRIRSMGEVIAGLRRIEGWEQQMLRSPMGEDGLRAAERLRQRSVATQRVASENAKARAEEASILAAAKSAVESFLQTALQQSASELQTGGALIAEVQDIAPVDKIRFANNGWLEPLGGRALSFGTSPGDPHRRHLLELILCEERRMRTRMINAPRTPDHDLHPAREIAFAVVARYTLLTDQRSPTALRNQGFLSNPKHIGTSRMRMPALDAGRGAQPQRLDVRSVMKTFIEGVALTTTFQAAQWPAPAEQVRDLIGVALAAFFAHIESDSPFVGD